MSRPSPRTLRRSVEVAAISGHVQEASECLLPQYRDFLAFWESSAYYSALIALLVDEKFVGDFPATIKFHHLEGVQILTTTIKNNSCAYIRKNMH